MVWLCFLFLFFLGGSEVISADESNDGPLISITSPDHGSTFAYGTLKSHQLFWNKERGLLMARVVYTNEDFANGQVDKADDTLEFSLPGIYLDPQKNIFWTRSTRGDIVPIARRVKQMVFATIEILPNANIRLIHDHGSISVILEALRPDDPNLKPTPPGEDTQTKRWQQLLQ